MKGLILAGACAVTVFISAGARADWNPGDPAKWVQLPDLTTRGMDVWDTQWPNPGSTTFKLLADDWQCTSTDPVTDVHIWGSWLNNHLPNGTAPLQGDPTAVTFKLSIHADIPGVTGGIPYSHPGAELWSTVVKPTAVRLYAPNAANPNIQESFYDPNINQIVGADNQVWQYNFLNLSDPVKGTFVQQGTAANPITYWLDVQVLSDDPSAVFGWKTAEPLPTAPFHRLDDAVFADTQGFNGPLLPSTANPFGLPWTDMHYPNDPLGGQSFDLAFVITPEPGTMVALAVGLMMMARRRV